MPETTDAFRERSCWRKITGYVEQCGTVTVPESDSSDKTIEIGLVRVFSNAAAPAPDPVVYLDGGPGQSAVGTVSNIFPAFEELAKDRDVIFIDQRGTGVTEPQLSCGAREELADCFESVSEEADLASYRTHDNARDIDLVRQALGYEKWNLLGISYGSRLGLTLMRDYPDGIRAVILDGVVPLEADLFGDAAQSGEASFEKTFAACQAQESCAEKYPDPMAELLAVVAKLDDDPIRICNEEVGGAIIVNLLFNLLYSPEALAFVPFLIHQLAEEDTELFEELSCNLRSSGFSLPMHLSVQCAEELAFTDRETIAALDAEVRPELVPGLSGAPYLTRCAEWPVPAAPELENERVESSLPALLFAGSFDPITPAKYAEQVHAALSNSEYFFLDGESHGASLSPCGLEISRSFLARPEAAPDSACLDDLPGLSFESLHASGDARTRVNRDRAARRPFITQRPTSTEVETARADLERRFR